VNGKKKARFLNFVPPASTERRKKARFLILFAYDATKQE
jgi:hypothetical protein